MNLDVMSALNELEKERGIAKEIILEAIEAAITSAYKRNYGTSQSVRVDVDDKTGSIKVYARKVVVDDVTDEMGEISLAEATAEDPNYGLDDVVEVEVTPSDFGRIAAQTAKQVVIQRIREAERALVYDEFSNRQGDVMTGIVQRWDHRNVIVDLGKVEAVLSAADQMPGDSHAQRTRLKVYVSEVKQSSKGPQVYVSRTHPGLVTRLFEMEVPEIHDGIVEIRAVAREAGARSKLAVSSRDENVDPVGACVGPRGMRVQAVVSELRGEKIDVIPWAALPEEFVGNALSPAKVVGVHLDEESKTARVVVPDNHLSLAIGKEGQNARLAARLTGWRIDIKSQEQMAQILAREAFERATPKETDTDLEEDIAEVAPLHEEEVTSATGVPPQVLPSEKTPEAEKSPSEPAELDTVLPDTEDVEVEVDSGAADELDLSAGPDQEVELDPAAEVDEEAEPDAMDAEARRKRPLRVVGGTAKAKSRKTRKQELESLLEEELVDAEPLPTLFPGANKQQRSSSVGHYVAGPQGDEKDKENTKQEPKTKKVIKDLSELSSVDFEFNE